MKATNTLPTLYLANATLLICHEIDSAFWQEWRLFGLPGGIQLFVVLHIPLVAVVIHGYGEIRVRTSSARTFSWLVVFGSLAAAAIHGSFLAAGRSGFRNPVSIGVLLTGVIVSLVQAAVTYRGSEALTPPN